MITRSYIYQNYHYYILNIDSPFSNTWKTDYIPEKITVEINFLLSSKNEEILEQEMHFP